jgi:hypothetical protein
MKKEVQSQILTCFEIADLLNPKEGGPLDKEWIIFFAARGLQNIGFVSKKTMEDIEKMEAREAETVRGNTQGSVEETIQG